MQCLFVIDRFGVHRTNQADVIREATGQRQVLTQLHSAVTIRKEFERTAEDVSFLFVEMSFECSPGIRLAVMFAENWLFIKEVDLTRTAMLKQADYGLRFLF